jgi:hypothetical protein
LPKSTWDFSIYHDLLKNDLFIIDSLKPMIFLTISNSYAPARETRQVRHSLGPHRWVRPGGLGHSAALVMNASVPVTRFVRDCVDVVLSGDPTNGINTGHVLVRNTAWSARFLERVYASTEFLHHPWRENAAVLRLYAEDPDVRRHAAVVPNKLFNGYPYPGAGYTDGDFVVHFAGLGASEREAAVRNYAAMAR